MLRTLSAKKKQIQILKKPPFEQDGGFLLLKESVQCDDGAILLRNSGEFSHNGLELITIHGFLLD